MLSFIYVIGGRPGDIYKEEGEKRTLPALMSVHKEGKNIRKTDGDIALWWKVRDERYIHGED